MNDVAQPTDGQRIALHRIVEMEGGGRPWFKPADAEECVDQGWAVKRGGGRYALTVEGRAILGDLAQDWPSCALRFAPLTVD